MALNTPLASPQVQCLHSFVKVTIGYRLAPPVVLSGFSVTTVYAIDGSGAIKIAVDMLPIRSNPANLPRVRLDFCLHESFQKVTWHGKGAHHSYKDSGASTRKGVYNSPISDLDFLYEIPQENGNRSEVEWVTITDIYGSGLLARFKDTTFNFQASHYCPDNITKARHIHGLERHKTTYLRLDYDHHDLGNASIKPFILPAYELKKQPVSFVVEVRTLG